eukprot:TRINITY_DN2527_c1_g1_i1.p1 TRINITY_DN2527_c1_g1~~TRINITY_DN2527_c1_g1_i1.p1  ORF type:complete len:463 (+),score=94.41 TRINITY_DN2527_c1_g1_i1:140-1390(+)
MFSSTLFRLTPTPCRSSTATYSFSTSTPSSSITRVGVVVIGGGVAGVGIAAALPSKAHTVLLEAAPQLATHSTGRSAAISITSYGGEVVRELTKRSRLSLASPPAHWLCGVPSLLTPRGILEVCDGSNEAMEALEREVAAGMKEVSVDEAMELVPLLNRSRITRAVYEEEAMDIDVDALVSGWGRKYRTEGGRIKLASRVVAITPQFSSNTRAQAPSSYLVTCSDGEVIHADVVVNAAGAWGDEVAKMAGVKPLGLSPLRRSMMIVAAPTGVQVETWPLFGDVSESWYAKPQSGKLVLSPADEEPVEPHDAYTSNEVLAEGVALFERDTVMEVDRVEASWAGLRTFSPDGSPSTGFDPVHTNFFWHCGQGGYGMQTSSALNALAANLLTNQGNALEVAVDLSVAPALSPSRFAVEQ